MKDARCSRVCINWAELLVPKIADALDVPKTADALDVPKFAEIVDMPKSD